jgi:hypothetical protein
MTAEKLRAVKRAVADLARRPASASTPPSTIHKAQPEVDFAADFIARRFGLTPSLARIVAALANLKRAFGWQALSTSTASTGRGSRPCLPWIVPGGKIVAREYVALNPTRADRRPGSFKVNMRTGRWSDFAAGDKGGDPVSLCAYVEKCS